MPSSMIFVSLVVLWLLILVPAVARHRQEVARPSTAALSGRVLERPRQRRDAIGRYEDGARQLEVDVMDDVDQPHALATRPERGREVRVPAARAEVRWPEATPPVDDHAAVDVDDAEAEDWDAGSGHDGTGHDERLWERPPPRYRPGRGGFDPEAAAIAARARYAFRQRVVLAMLIVALATGVLAAAAVPGLWWPHSAVDLVLVGYLVYLRRQVRMEESIRERRAARMAGTRRPPAADDPDLDEWARRGREVAGRAPGEHVAHRPDDAARTVGDVVAEDRGGDLDGDLDGDLAGDDPERVRGTGEPLRTPRTGEPLPDPTEGEPALPRLQPAPPPPLPAGTALVETDEEDPELHDLDGPARPDYRRAAGE
jgi:hypothetical protein